MKKLFAVSLILLLVACAGYGGKGLIVGESGMDDVIRVMGEPRMQWVDADGTRHLGDPCDGGL